MKFRDKYPKLANFLGAWFPDAGIEDLDDREVIAKFLRTPNQDEHNAVRAELGKLLSESEPLPWDDIGKEANRHFKSGEECRLWLSMVKEELGSDKTKGTMN
jgi:hypothetical protein